MSDITYDKNKVEQFKSAFKEYQAARKTFKSEMTQFKNTMDFMEGNLHGKRKEGENATNENYVINKDGILMKIYGKSDWGYDSSVNTVIHIDDEKKAFVTNIQYQGKTGSVNETNKLYQVGLADIKYDNSQENVIAYNNKFVQITDTPTINDNLDCKLTHLSQCSAKAKMENKSYYGIEGGTSSDNQTICNCYVFDEQPTQTIGEKIKSITVNSDETSFLATLMDGKFYRIKNNTYSNNYNGFYEHNSSSDEQNLDELIGNDKLGGGLNPFVGDGINSISITTLGNYCMAAGN